MPLPGTALMWEASWGTASGYYRQRRGGVGGRNTVMLPVGFRAVSDGANAELSPLQTSPSTKRYSHVANIKSQIKPILTNKKSQDRNKAVKSEVKTAVRATRTAIAAGDKAAATTALLTASKKLDKAASKGVIHKNQAANKKSAIAKQVAAL